MNITENCQMKENTKAAWNGAGIRINVWKAPDWMGYDR